MSRDSKRPRARTVAGSGASTNADVIRAYHRLGKRIAARVDQDSSIDKAIRDEGYGESRFTAYKAHQFARLVHTDAEFQRYLSAAGEGLFSWTHVQVLLQVTSSRDRRQYFERAKRDRWNAKRLRQEITKRRPFGQTEQQRRQGRKFRVPKSAEDLRATLDEMLRRPYGLLGELLAEDSLVAIELDAGQRRCLVKLKKGMDEFARDFRSC